MMRFLVLALVALFPVLAFAAPFADADLPDQLTTHCAIAYCAPDGTSCGAYSADVPVVLNAGVRYCHADAANAPTGARSVRVLAVVVDPLWGRLPSAPSAPLPFTRPANPAAPVNIRLVP